MATCDGNLRLYGPFRAIETSGSNVGHNVPGHFVPHLGLSLFPHSVLKASAKLASAFVFGSYSMIDFKAFKYASIKEKTVSKTKSK
jgi:hypothetical protein